MIKTKQTKQKNPLCQPLELIATVTDSAVRIINEKADSSINLQQKYHLCTVQKGLFEPNTKNFQCWL